MEKYYLNGYLDFDEENKRRKKTDCGLQKGTTSATVLLVRDVRFQILV